MQHSTSWKLSLGAASLFCVLGLSGDSNATVVAVIDTGIETDHPALSASLWENPGEIGLDSKGRSKKTNGVDDDGNGFIDDVNGWNFVSHSNNVSDRHGHGTHVAGLILGAQPASRKAASTDSKSTSSKEGVRLMILKYYDPGTSEQQNLMNSVKAIRYATKMQAQIINYSGGGAGSNLSEESAIRAASKAGILFVAAAGNERQNSDVFSYYPADYAIPNILSVAALSENGRLIASSNFGRNSVDLAAQGEEMMSTLPGAAWGRMTGTSQAAAVVTGVAARLREKRPDLKEPSDLMRELIRAGKHDESLKGKTRHQVRVDESLLERI